MVSIWQFSEWVTSKKQWKQCLSKKITQCLWWGPNLGWLDFMLSAPLQSHCAPLWPVSTQAKSSMYIVYLFVWFDCLRPINNLSDIRDRSSCVEPVLSYDYCVLLKDTTQWHWWGSNRGSLVSSQALYHWATALPVHCLYMYLQNHCIKRLWQKLITAIL